MSARHHEAVDEGGHESINQVLNLNALVDFEPFTNPGTLLVLGQLSLELLILPLQLLHVLHFLCLCVCALSIATKSNFYL